MGHVAGTEERRNVYKVLVGKPRGKNILKMYLIEVVCEGMDWTKPARGRALWSVLSQY